MHHHSRTDNQGVLLSDAEQQFMARVETNTNQWVGRPAITLCNIITRTSQQHHNNTNYQV